MPSVLFIGKAGNPNCEKALAALKESKFSVTERMSSRGERFPSELHDWKGDYLISFLSQWVIPQAVLDNAKVAAINFHPGPPEYPGIGCTNFALYNEEKTFGVTCHHMAAKVDTGSLIAVKRFPIQVNDTVYSLTQKCYVAIDELFEEILSVIVNGGTLPFSKETWSRKPYRRDELNALCELTSDMSEDEIRRRIRATTFPGMPGPYIVIGGKRFILDTNQ